MQFPLDLLGANIEKKLRKKPTEISLQTHLKCLNSSIVCSIVYHYSCHVPSFTNTRKHETKRETLSRQKVPCIRFCRVLH